MTLVWEADGSGRFTFFNGEALFSFAPKRLTANQSDNDGHFSGLDQSNISKPDARNRARGLAEDLITYLNMHPDA